MNGRIRRLAWGIDPLEALGRWPADRRVLLLHSGRFHPRWATRSILAEPAGVYRFNGAVSHWTGSPFLGSAFTATHQPFRDLRGLIQGSDGLWIGYLSYDLGRWIEPALGGPLPGSDWPIIELAYCPGYLVYDLAESAWTACGTYATDGEPQLASDPDGQADFSTSEPVSVFTRSDYEQSVERALAYIAAGDAFQVNLAQRFSASLDGPYPFAQRTLFQRLAAVSPAWYGAYLELDGRRVLASTSPELFLQSNRSGAITTRPIKGTRPASVDADELRDSEKDKAELNMIVDLMRNDLGRVCAYGSIRVAQARAIESHPTVHHGVATITGRLHHSRDVVDLLRATMPGGSVTGAPKIRAMQIIEELEPVRRGPYCGAIGYLSRTETCLNIAIRTMLLTAAQRRLDFSVGGGIVADSRPDSEYEETLCKAQAIVSALKRQTSETPVVAPTL